MQGVEVRELPGMTVARLHYSADPAKQSAEWQKSAHAGMSDRDFKREYEIDWTIAEGLGIYVDDFDRGFHVASGDVEPLVDIPMSLGFDFGLNPCVIFGQVTPEGALVLLREVVTWDGRGEQKQQGLDQLLGGLVPMAKRLYHDLDWQSDAWVDPAGFSRSEADERTCVDVLTQYGIYAQPGAIGFETRRAATSRLLNGNIGGSPKLLISPSCKMVIEGLQGAYQYKRVGDGSGGGYIERPVKNAWSHPINALEYMVSGIFGMIPVSEPGIDDDDVDEEGRESKRYY